jgi:hypothetical protein
MKAELSKEVFTQEDRDLLDKATELFKLFQDAIKLGFSISFTPDQLKELVEICEAGYMFRPEKKDSTATST